MSTHPLQRRRPISPRARAPRPCSRRASVYILVLATAAIATAAGLGGLYIQRTHVRAARTAADIDRARVLASSGLEYAMARIEADASWRSSIGAGTWYLGALGPGTLTVVVDDPIDGNISNSPTDDVRVLATGVVGSATQSLTARMSIKTTPMNVLACSAYGRNLVYFDRTSYTADGPVASGANMSAALISTVNANAEAVGSISGLTYLRPTTAGATPRAVPTSSIISQWAAMGSVIPYAGLSGGNTLKDGLVTKNSSIAGSPPNAQGIYVIDCAGGPLTIDEVRLYGTLVVLNSSLVTLTHSVRLDPNTPGYPCLVVQGPLTMDYDTGTVDESSTRGNYNPVGTPWLGATDTDTTDKYPSGISGLVFATGTIRIKSDVSMTGCLVSLGDVTVEKPTTITVDPVLMTTPPPGFYTGTPYLSSTGVARVVN